MSSVQLHQVSYLPTGSIRQVHPVSGVLRTMVYQRVHPKFGNRGVRGSVGLQERAHVIPVDPRTAAQVQQRVRMSLAVAAWSALPEPERGAYRVIGMDMAITGYQYFVSLSMRGLT